MDRDLFVSELKALAPSKDDFQNLAVSDSFIKQHIGRYNCELRTKSRLKIVTNDEFLNLLQEYDCSSLGIGNLYFSKTIDEHESYYQIGKVEMDILVLNKITLEIEVRDHDQLNYTIWSCASKSTCFLDALLTCATFFSRLLKEPSIGDDSEYVFNVVKNCAEQAGGEKYIDFYKMLLGYFD